MWNCVKTVNMFLPKKTPMILDVLSVANGERFTVQKLLQAKYILPTNNTTMKPSERIKEIIIGNDMRNPPSDDVSASMYTAQRAERFMNAMCEYLDLEWEKSKPCTHKESYPEESIDGSIAYNVCCECGVLFMAEDSGDTIKP